MYTTSAAFKTAMASPSRELTTRGKITFPDASTHSLTPVEISKFTITENAGDHLPLGGVSASTLTLILDNRLGEWEPGGSILGTKSLDGATVELEIGVNNSGYEYANAGVFVIEKPVSQEQDAIITIKGSDYLANRALRAFSDTLTYPQTVLQIVTEACLQANITLKTTVFINSAVSIPVKPVWDENTTCRDVISYVACLAGGFARIDRNGELEIISFDNQAEGLYSQLLDSSFAIVDGELIWTYPAGYTGPAVTLVGSDLFIDEENIARLNDGEFQFIGTYDGTNYYVHPNRYRKLSNQGVMFGAFNALSVYEHGAPNGYGATRIADDIDIVDNELNSIAVRGNPLLAYGGTALTTLMTNMLASLGGLEYYAASIEWQGDPSITCGDMVTISNLKGEAYNVLITNQTLTFDNGFTMATGNRLNTAVVGKAKVENLRVFTPTGKLNAAALEGDINIRAGRQLNLLSDGALVVKSGAEMNIASGGKLTLASGNDVDIGADTLADLLAAATSQTTIWYQTSQPTATATGDIWYDTDATPITIKRWDGSAWVDITTTALSQALTAAGDAQATADGKIKAWAQTTAPSATAVGDLWIDTDDNNKLYRATAAGTGNWVLYKVAAGYVATSKITIDDDAISIASGGSLTLTAPTTLSITAGATNATAIAIRNNTDYFISAGHLTQSSAPFYVKKDGTVKASAGLIGDFTLSSGHLVHSNSSTHEFVDLSKWGLAIGEDASSPNYHFPFSVSSVFDANYGHLRCSYGRLGALDFNPDIVIIKTASTVYSGTRNAVITLDAANGNITTIGTGYAAGDWLDTTPGYKGGSAVDELKLVKNDKDGNVDHSTLPAFALKKIKCPAVTRKNEKGAEIVLEPERELEGRGLGAMISILTKAVQELDARLERVENGKKL